MKTLHAAIFALLILVPTPVRAASDTDVTLLKVKKVVIEENSITIVADAKARITLVREDYDPAYKGDNWHGMAVNRLQVISGNGTFIIERREEKNLLNAWKETVEQAKNLQEGKTVGRIGFYAPEIVIKGNMIRSITGHGYLYP